MTCIVAVEHDGKVWMGGDSAASRDNDVVCRTNEKVFVNGDFLIGYSGSFRVGQLLQYSFKPQKPLHTQSTMEYLVNDFVDCLRNLLRDKGAMLKDEEGDAQDSEFLLGFRGKIYVIEPDFNIGKPTENYASCGTGASYAMGALYALSESSAPPEDKIIKALSAASEYCNGVKPPFTILKK